MTFPVRSSARLASSFPVTHRISDSLMWSSCQVVIKTSALGPGRFIHEKAMMSDDNVASYSSTHETRWVDVKMMSMRFEKAKKIILKEILQEKTFLILILEFLLCCSKKLRARELRQSTTRIAYRIRHSKAPSRLAAVWCARSHQRTAMTNRPYEATFANLHFSFSIFLHEKKFFFVRLLAY